MSVFMVKETPLNLWRQLFVTLIADDAIRCIVIDLTAILVYLCSFSCLAAVQTAVLGPRFVHPLFASYYIVKTYFVIPVSIVNKLMKW